MKPHKVNAFTLSEMLVVLVVASILISMGFLVLNMVRKQVQLIQKNYQLKQEVQFFETTLARDFNTRNVFYNEQRNVFIMKNTKDNIQYYFFDSHMIRQKDTFQIEVAHKKLFLDGKVVKDKKVDAIELHLSVHFANKQLFIQKTNDASYYLNN